MQIIIPPAKTQQFIGRDYGEYSMPILLAKTRVIIDLLKTMSEPELARLLKTRDMLTQSTHHRIHKFAKHLTLQNAGQAIFTFQGDTYAALAAENFFPDDLQFAQRQLFILSGLYGILRPLDLIQPYRLEMSAPLPVAEAQNLYRYWREPVTEIINRALAEDEERTLVNLASTEYARVVDCKKLQGKMVTITFREQHDGGYRTVPVHAKKARGLMIRFIVTGRITETEGLRDFHLDGYSFSGEDSTAEEWLFYKKE
ncbi:MAG TPA: hypothetical protein DDY32_14320 [Desulfobulbaceae bacterium]|nr:hypothetical protein [Desulfobulbaceae bacterium]